MDDHDQRFKTLLREFLPEFVALFFPDWAGHFDFTGCEWLEQEAFLDPPQGEKRVLDVVAKLPTRQPVPDPSGRPADHSLVVVNIEVESPERATDIRPRMLWHYESLRRRHGLPVLPVCLFLRVGLNGLGWDTYEEQLWGVPLLRFGYAYIGLPRLDGLTYFNGPNLLGLALSALMRLPAADRARLKAEGLARIARSRENEVRKYLLAECFENYLRLDPAGEAEATRIEAEQFPEDAAMAEINYREIANVRKMLRRQLEKKFGPLTDWQQDEVMFMPPDKLEPLALALIDAKSLDELGLADKSQAPADGG